MPAMHAESEIEPKSLPAMKPGLRALHRRRIRAKTTCGILRPMYRRDRDHFTRRTIPDAARRPCADARRRRRLTGSLEPAY